MREGTVLLLQQSRAHPPPGLEGVQSQRRKFDSGLCRDAWSCNLEAPPNIGIRRPPLPLTRDANSFRQETSFVRVYGNEGTPVLRPPLPLTHDAKSSRQETFFVRVDAAKKAHSCYARRFHSPTTPSRPGRRPSLFV